MELHIKQIQHTQEVKKYSRIILLILSSLLISVSLLLSSINYFSFEFFMIFALFISVIEICLIIYMKKMHKLQKMISSDLVIVDKSNRFFYNNMIFELSSLKEVRYNTQATRLIFEDYHLILEYDLQHIEYFKQFTNKLLNIEITTKLRMILFMEILLVMAFLTTLFNNIFGGIYMLMSNQIIDIIPLYIDIAVMLIAAISCILFRYIKKYIILIFSLVIVGILIFVPWSPIEYLSYDDSQIAYIRHDNYIEVYNDVKYHYGKKVAELDWKNTKTINIYNNVLYAYDEKDYFFYDLEKSQTSLDDFYKLNNETAYNNTAYSFTIEIYDHKITISNKECQISSVGYNIVYLVHETSHYLLMIEDNEAYVYDLNHQTEIRLDKNNSLLDKTNKTTKEDPVIEENNEPGEVINYNELQKQKDKENYEIYQKTIQQDDISNYQSNKNVVKITSDNNDIYRVIKELDQEYTRINNEEDVDLDVQIKSMIIYSQADNEYGIYIYRRVDSSNAESQSYSQVILMKKYGNDYIGTRFDDLSYMPSVGITNNGSYDTSTTTDFLLLSRRKQGCKK